MKKGLLVFVIVILLIVICAMGGYIFLNINSEEEIIGKSYLAKTFKDDDLKSIENVIKEYSYDNNLADKKNIKKWEIEEIKYLGYFNNDKDIYYYEVTGGYLCEDGTGDCVYVAQSEYLNIDMNSYHVYVALKKMDDEYSLVSIDSVIETTTQMVTEDKDGFKNTGYEYDELVRLYKDYIIGNGLALKPDINEWDVKLIYLGKQDEDLIFNVKPLPII